MLTVKIENTYSDGHTSKHEELVTYDSAIYSLDKEDIEQWFEDIVWPLTGDGYGSEHPELHAHYIAEIISADDENLLGEWFEWV